MWSVSLAKGPFLPWPCPALARAPACPPRPFPCSLSPANPRVRVTLFMSSQAPWGSCPPGGGQSSPCAFSCPCPAPAPGPPAAAGPGKVLPPQGLDTGSLCSRSFSLWHSPAPFFRSLLPRLPWPLDLGWQPPWVSWSPLPLVQCPLLASLPGGVLSPLCPHCQPAPAAAPPGLRNAHFR